MQPLGKEIENLAGAYLKQQGLKLVTVNYRCKMGEVDLIMWDSEILVFIEVRFRRNANYGDGVATINSSKQRRIKKAAVHYLQQHNLYDKVACRFDVISVASASKFDSHNEQPDGHRAGDHARYTITWLKDAF